MSKTGQWVLDKQTEYIEQTGLDPMESVNDDPNVNEGEFKDVKSKIEEMRKIFIRYLYNAVKTKKPEDISHARGFMEAMHMEKKIINVDVV